MKNLLLIFMMLFVVDSIAQLDQREKGDVVSPALNKNPNFIQKTGWTIEAIDPINDTLCSVTPSSDNLTILTTNVCNARVYQDINSADIRKARFDKETMTAFLKLQSLTYVKITLNVYKKAASTGTLTLLRTRSLENNSGVLLRNKKIIFDVVTEDLNFVPNANLADSLRIEFTFEPTVVFPAGVAEVEVNDFRVFSSPMNYSPLLHEVKEESGWTKWQPITITAQTTNPTKGTTTTDACRKRRDGTQLKIDFEYRQGSAGTAGSGVYFFSCGGITLNGENLTPDYDLANNVSIGSGDGTSGTFGVVLNTSGQILLSNSAGTISSTNVSMSQSGLIYRFNASIAIKEWKQSSLSATQLSDASNPKSAPYYTAYIDNTVNPPIVRDQNVNWISSCTRSIDGEISCPLSSGVTINPNLCGVTRNNAPLGGNVVGNIRNTSTGTNLAVVTATGSGGFNVAFNVTCFKSGQSYLDAFKQYISGQFKESNIVKDVEQFPLTEQKLCDACAQGEALYKRCCNVNSNITSSGDICELGTNITPQGESYPYTAGSYAIKYIQSSAGTDRSLVYYNKSDGFLKASISGSAFFVGVGTYCVEYLKD